MSKVTLSPAFKWRQNYARGGTYNILSDGKSTGAQIDAKYLGGDLIIDWIGDPSHNLLHPRQLGVGVLRGAFRELRRLYPGAERVLAHRVSGATAVRDSRRASALKNIPLRRSGGGSWDESKHPRDEKGRWE